MKGLEGPPDIYLNQDGPMGYVQGNHTLAHLPLWEPFQDQYKGIQKRRSIPEARNSQDHRSLLPNPEWTLAFPAPAPGKQRFRQVCLDLEWNWVRDLRIVVETWSSKLSVSDREDRQAHRSLYWLVRWNELRAQWVMWYFLPVKNRKGEITHSSSWTSWIATSYVRAWLQVSCLEGVPTFGAFTSRWASPTSLHTLDFFTRAVLSNMAKPLKGRSIPTGKAAECPLHVCWSHTALLVQVMRDSKDYSTKRAVVIGHRNILGLWFLSRNNYHRRSFFLDWSRVFVGYRSGWRETLMDNFDILMKSGFPPLSCANAQCGIFMQVARSGTREW